MFAAPAKSLQQRAEFGRIVCSSPVSSLFKQNNDHHPHLSTIVIVASHTECYFMTCSSRDCVRLPAITWEILVQKGNDVTQSEIQKEA
jgi:hypothetical protein